MKLALATLAIVILGFTGIARADGAPADMFVEITGQNIILGGDTLNFSMEMDATTGQLVPGSVVISLGGVDNSDWTCPGGLNLCVNAAAGAALQISATDDYAQEIIGPTLFPDPGIYPAALVDITCGFASQCFDAVGDGFELGDLPVAYGEVVVTDPPPPGVPEPGTLPMLLSGIFALVFLFAPVRWIRRAAGIPVLGR